MFTELEKYPQMKPEKRRTLGFTAFPIPSYIRSEARHHDGFFHYEYIIMEIQLLKIHGLKTF